MTSFDDIDRMTIPEYLMAMKAYRYKLVEEERDMHFQAYLNFIASSTVKVGKKIEPKFKTFKSFYDYDARIAELEGEKAQPQSDERTQNILKMQRKINGERRS